MIWFGIFENCTCALEETIISRFKAVVQGMSCSIRFVLVHFGAKWMASTHTHLLSKRNGPLSRVFSIECYLFSLFYLFISVISFFVHYF